MTDEEQKAADESLERHLKQLVVEEPIARYFTFAHLPPRLRDISRQFAIFARNTIAEIPRSEERCAGLRKLLEAKDCIVRAALP